MFSVSNNLTLILFFFHDDRGLISVFFVFHSFDMLDCRDYFFLTKQVYGLTAQTLSMYYIS